MFGTVATIASINTAGTANTADSVDLSWWEATILGLVEGLTEYLPVSSTGHLLFVAELLGLADTAESEDAIETFSICIQLGAILAVLWLYQHRIRAMVDGALGRDEVGRRVLGAVIAAFIPTAIIGFALRNWVKDALFAPWAIATAWVAGGLAILWLARADWFRRGTTPLDDMTIRMAVVVGVAQSIALWPGVSRSLVTIVAAVAVGLTLSAAVEFAFLLGVVTLGAATVLEGAENGPAMVDTFGWATPTLGLVVGFVAAVAAIRWMVAWLESRGFAVFGWYRIAVGVIGFALIAFGTV